MAEVAGLETALGRDNWSQKDWSKNLYRRAMKIEQIMENLRIEIRTIQEELKAILKARYEEMRAE
jgi:hypothetical protein